MTPEIKAAIVRWICSTEPKSICESLDLDLEELEEEIDMFLVECQEKLLSRCIDCGDGPCECL